MQLFEIYSREHLEVFLKENNCVEVDDRPEKFPTYVLLSSDIWSGITKVIFSPDLIEKNLSFGLAKAEAEVERLEKAYESAKVVAKYFKEDLEKFKKGLN